MKENVSGCFFSEHSVFGANTCVWAYLKYVLSYSIFCVYISKFSLLWHQGLVWVKFRLHN